MDFGIRCVIASSFGDIFYANSVKNGLLCIRLEEEVLHNLRSRAASGSMVLDIDVERESISLPEGGVLRFSLEPAVKQWLIEGLDEIEYTLRMYGEAIRRYEEGMRRYLKPRRDAAVPLE